ncbi:hypothetical protein QBC39DRAFT_32840 [Podospora conica]|nr:hypothetical protein QBC39DRAFT_32840 [Schizothecium conicum]
MHPAGAPEARIYARELWDAVTHAAGGVFAVGGPGPDPTPTRGEVVIATVIKQAVVARQDGFESGSQPPPAPAPPPPALENPSLPSEVLPTGTELPSEVLPTNLPSEVAPQETLAVAAPSAVPPSTETELVIAPEITKAETTAPGREVSATIPAISSPTASSAPVDSGDNIGLKAGIIFGSLAGVLVIMIGVWVIFSRRRKRMDEQQAVDDEKVNGPLDPFGDHAAIKTPARAPRLSLRPVTQFLPMGVLPERRTSRSAGLVLGPIAEPQESQLQRPTGRSAWERPSVASSTYSPTSFDRPGTSNSVHSGNPFNDSQRLRDGHSQDRAVSPVSPVPSVARLASPTPEPVSPIDSPQEEMPWGTAAAHAAGAGKQGLARKASLRKDAPRALDLTMPPPPSYLSFVPPSPAGTEYSMHSVAPGQKLGPSSSAAAIAAAGGPPQSTVHRVTLDFKPTLDDELGLKAGQLVRLLHEYDDGWALCIRLDRSEQGVVPRTCLSSRPVKPRNADNDHGKRRGGPPINPRRPSYPEPSDHRRQESSGSVNPSPLYQTRSNNSPPGRSYMHPQQAPDDGFPPGQAY